MSFKLIKNIESNNKIRFTSFGRKALKVAAAFVICGAITMGVSYIFSFEHGVNMGGVPLVREQLDVFQYKRAVATSDGIKTRSYESAYQIYGNLDNSYIIKKYIPEEETMEVYTKKELSDKDIQSLISNPDSVNLLGETPISRDVNNEDLINDETQLPYPIEVEKPATMGEKIGSRQQTVREDLDNDCLGPALIFGTLIGVYALFSTIKHLEVEGQKVKTHKSKYITK
jgi:hypothetical protein